MDISASPSPTTTSPITLPAEKAARSPLLRLSLQAVAVRALAAVAIFIPKKPDRPEKTPPVTKAKGINGPTKPARASAPSTRNIQAKKTATTRYCRFKKAFAPLRMMAATRPAPSSSGIFSTRRAKNSANASASTAAAGAIRIAYSIVSPLQGAPAGSARKKAAFFYMIARNRREIKPCPKIFLYFIAEFVPRARPCLSRAANCAARGSLLPPQTACQRPSAVV